MSQNSIITTIIVILGVTVGVYFYFSSSPSTNTNSITYDESKPTTSTASEPVNVRDTASSNSVTTPTQPAVPTSTSQPGSSETTSAGNNSSTTGDQKPPEPVIIKFNYTVIIKGTVDRLAKPFAIKASDSQGNSQEYTQEKLVDGVYKFESEKIFTSIAINVENYAPVLKENLTLLDKKLTVEIEMEPYAIVSGDVKSFLEKPIPGASVTIEKGAYKKTLHADVQGTFKLTEQIPAGQYSFSINHPKFDSKKMVVEIAKGEEKNINIKLERDAIIEALVNTSEGKPAMSLEGVLKHESDETKSKTFITDEKGRFQLSKIADGKYTMIVDSMQGSLTEAIEFSKNMEVVRDFKLLPPPSVSGVLVDEAGKPVAGIKLFTFDDKKVIEDETKADGKFNLILIKKGEYRVLTSSESYELINPMKLYTPSLEKIVLQVKKKAFLVGKILTPAGVIVKKDYTLKLINKTKKTSIPLFANTNKEGKILIPLSTFKFIAADDEIQIGVDSTSFGKGVSLSMKAGSISEDSEFLITLGE